ncbi:hypothetical protein EDD18DRAFT_442473 [Armillaria luteobubalina]|uniref:Uncharacterized protein n=1 Tax=Armillaria luteobubalina TaxID=153913 RepID=A0AA39PYJ3_9AGAR|nr:hypothetical protein EDD18DRAFT_442473 [Armillaria luteobubalina]
MLLLILLCCIKFAHSNGFHFDEFSGTVLSLGIPITLSWHFDIGDPDEVFFQRRHILQQSFFQGDLGPAEITHANRTLNVTLPSNGHKTFIVDAKQAAQKPSNSLIAAGFLTFRLHRRVVPVVVPGRTHTNQRDGTVQLVLEVSRSSFLLHLSPSCLPCLLGLRVPGRHILHPVVPSWTPWMHLKVLVMRFESLLLLVALRGPESRIFCLRGPGFLFVSRSGAHMIGIYFLWV